MMKNNTILVRLPAKDVINIKKIQAKYELKDFSSAFKVWKRQKMEISL